MIGWLRRQARRGRFAAAPAPAAAGAGVLDIDVADRLGRPAVNLDTPELQRFLAGKVVLVSGAGASIGSEICRQAMKLYPRRLLVLDRAEYSLFDIDRELKERWLRADIVPVLWDIY